MKIRIKKDRSFNQATVTGAILFWGGILAIMMLTLIFATVALSCWHYSTLGLLFHFPILIGCIGGSSHSDTSDNTQTASGSGTNVSGRGGTVAQPGAIAVGQSGQYREAGSIDLSGLRTTGTGTTNVNIVPQAALDTLKSLADKFSNTVQSIAGGGGSSPVVLSGPASTAAGINYKKLIIGGILAVLGFLGLRALFGGKKP